MLERAPRGACGALIAALLLASNAAADPGSSPVQIEPAPLHAGGPLHARLLGPFSQPAPELELRIETGRIVLRAYHVDFVDPQLPPVDFVDLLGTAPAAGSYQVVLETCGGNPPPPNPACSITVLQRVQVLPTVGVPTLSPWARLLLPLALATLGWPLLRRRRALNASNAP